MNLALLELHHPIEFNELVQPVTLPSDCGENLDSEYAIAVGNGETKSPDWHSWYKDLRLRQLDIQIMPQWRCELKKIKSEKGSIICSYPTHRRNLFVGDSGTYLHTIWYKIHENCCSEDVNSLYTRA